MNSNKKALRRQRKQTRVIWGRTPWQRPHSTASGLKGYRRKADKQNLLAQELRHEDN